DPGLRHDRPDPPRPVAAPGAGTDGGRSVAGYRAPVPAARALAVPPEPAAGSPQRALRARPCRDPGLRRPAHQRAHAGPDGGRPAGGGTPSQTATAYFWAASPIDQFEGPLENVITEHRMDAVGAARLLAMSGLAGADAIIGCWDAKYSYLMWRPITAIQNG